MRRRQREEQTLSSAQVDLARLDRDSIARIELRAIVDEIVVESVGMEGAIREWLEERIELDKVLLLLLFEEENLLLLCGRRSRALAGHRQMHGMVSGVGNPNPIPSHSHTPRSLPWPSEWPMQWPFAQWVALFLPAGAPTSTIM